MKTFSKFFNKSGKTLLAMMALVCGLVIAATAFVSCDDGGDDDKKDNKPALTLGDTGPAGGIIFYVDEADEYADWTYLEAAPADLSGTYQWGGYDSDCATGTAVGTGAANTVELITHDHGTPSNGSGLHLAAQACADYSYGGYDDWFLPSKDELDLMYTNLKAQGLGGDWSNAWYWSSSQYGSDDAWIQGFSDDNQIPYHKDGTICVRCVRAF